MDLIKISGRIVYTTRIRRFLSCLIFLFLIISCENLNNQQSWAVIRWEQGRAKGIVIGSKHLLNQPKDSIVSHLKIIRETDNHSTKILGEYSIESDSVLFRPLIPFSPGSHYHVYWKEENISEFDIPARGWEDLSKVLDVYPGIDTVPENLLKFYIHFSNSMAEGRAYENLFLIRDGKDTLSSVFLDLQQELWNRERTILTVWLDPGRIKRDLQPNKELGPPLSAGSSYNLVIKRDWLDSYGSGLQDDFNKFFYVGGKDTQKPDIEKWVIKIPATKTVDPLIVKFNEPLDYILAGNSIQVFNKLGEVKGNIQVGEKETVFRFIPGTAWLPGNYTLIAASRLEDLAGNNLERLFDQEVGNDKPNTKTSFELVFTIK
jgi:hypothetical protein